MTVTQSVAFPFDASYNIHISWKHELCFTNITRSVKNCHYYQPLGPLNIHFC